MTTGLNERIAQQISGLPRKPVVAIVAPSGYAPNDASVQKGIEVLTELGCDVRNFYDPSQKFQRFGADDAGRAAQLHAAAADPSVDIILALRGGYGLTRLLPSLDLASLAASGKLFVGHSDFTVLHMGLLTHGAISYAGPMLCDDFVRDELSEYTLTQFWRTLLSAQCTVEGTAAGNPTVDVSGALWGGNLAMLTHLVGTPYMPAVDGGILFVEDVNEHPYRIERMLLQLAHAGVLETQRAIVLGDFSGYRLVDYDNGYNFDGMLAYLRRRVSVPIVTGLPFGHGRDKATLAVGAAARLIVAGESLQLAMYGYPTLASRTSA